MQGAIEVDLEQNGRMVSGSSCGGRLGPGEAESLEIEFIDEGVNHPHRIVLRDVVVQALGEQQRLLAVFDDLRRVAV